MKTTLPPVSTTSTASASRRWHLPLTALLLAAAGFCAPNASAQEEPKTSDSPSAAITATKEKPRKFGNSAGTANEATQQAVYMGTAVLRIFPGSASENEIGTELALMKSGIIIDRVLKRLPAELRKKVTEPYREGKNTQKQYSDSEVLRHCRESIRYANTSLVFIRYFHPDSEVAAKLARFFAEEIQAQSEENRLKVISPALEFARLTVAKLEKDLAGKQAEKSALILANPKLLELETGVFPLKEYTEQRASVIAEKEAFREREAFYKQLQEMKKKGTPFTRLRKMVNVEGASDLISLISAKKIQLETMKLKTNDDKSPTIISLKNEIKEAEQKLDKVFQKEIKDFEENHETIKSSIERDQKWLTEKQEEIVGLLDIRERLRNLEREIASGEKTIANLEQVYFTERLRTISPQSQRIEILESGTFVGLRPSSKGELVREFWKLWK